MKWEQLRSLDLSNPENREKAVLMLATFLAIIGGLKIHFDQAQALDAVCGKDRSRCVAVDQSWCQPPMGCFDSKDWLTPTPGVRK